MRKIIGYILFLIPILFRRWSSKRVSKKFDVTNEKHFLKGYRNIQIASNKLAFIKNVKYEVINPPKDDKYIIVANHVNMYDIITLIHGGTVNTTFVSKKEVADEFVGNFARSIGVYFIDREDIRQTARELLKMQKEFTTHQHSVTFFPEGTRNDTLGEFQTGSFSVAKKLGAPILPVALINTDRKLKYKGKKLIRIVYGEPFMPTKEDDPKDLATKCHDIIAKAIKEHAIPQK